MLGVDGQIFCSDNKPKLRWKCLYFFAAAMASLTALSFGELCRRYLYSAGEAFYVREAFHWEWVSTLVGLLVVLTGLVSAVALVNGFIGYLEDFIEVHLT
jgi:amino acid transporter